MGEKKKLFCARCKYKFLFDTDSMTNMKCPYCGKDDMVHKDDPESAKNILKSLG